MVYLIILILLIFLSYFFDFRKQNNYKYSAYNSILLILILVAGLRYRVGLDTIRYMNSFQNMPTISEIWSYNFSETHQDPMWILLGLIPRSLSSDFTLFQILHAIIVNTTVFAFIRKNTKYIFTAVLFYYLFCYTNFNFEIMKESLAVSFFLIGSKYIDRKKWISYFLLCFFAFLSHPSAIITFIFPFFSRLKLNKKAVIFLIAIFAFFSIVQLYLSDLIPYFLLTDRMEYKLSRYINSEYLGGKGLNILGQIQSLVNTCFFPLGALYYSNKLTLSNGNHRFSGYIIFLALLTIININILIFYRFLNYFIIFYIIVLTDAFQYTKEVNRYLIIKQLIPFIIGLISLLQIYVYFKPEHVENESVKTYHRYYPYHSVITKKKNSVREELLNYYGL